MFYYVSIALVFIFHTDTQPEIARMTWTSFARVVATFSGRKAGSLSRLSYLPFQISSLSDPDGQ